MMTGLGDNSSLYTTATEYVVPTNNTNDDIAVGTSGADSYYFNNSGANKTGDDRIESFGHNDSIVNYKPIFDGNGDGIIDFGSNGILDIDRTSSKNAGADQITVAGLASKQLRYLGTKGDGNYVYADAATRLAGFTEGTVGNNHFDGSNGHSEFFYDTALGLNLGGDTITNFIGGDQIVTTTAIYNGTDGDLGGTAITLGKNGVLDLPGQTDGSAGDNGTGHGGQIDFGNAGLQLYLESVDHNANGVTYYHYGLTPPLLA